MTEPPSAITPEWFAPARRPSFSTAVTILCTIVVALYIGLLGHPLVEPHSSPLNTVERPAASLERLVTRDLELRAAMRGGAAWEWRLYRALSGDDDPLEEANDWYAELLEVEDAPIVRFQHAVILAESHRTAELREAIAEWGDATGVQERMAAWLTSAYLGAPPDEDVEQAQIAEIEAELPDNWFSDPLIARSAARVGDDPARERAEAAILARGRALLAPARILMAGSLALLALGLAAAVWLFLRRAQNRVGDAPVPPIWPPADGYALFVRALGAPQALLLVLFVVLQRETTLGTVLGMAADLPVFWWLAWYLHAHRSTVTEAFGLAPPPRRWPALVGTALVLIAAALVGDALIDVAASYLPVDTHWSDGFPEELLWASPTRLVAETAAATVWAPAIEELTFRGLLYATLRTRLGVVTSVVLSAALFALPHGYGVAGSLSVLLSGVLWAVAYERTRSLWPGLLAHCANNVLSTLWTVTLLR
jgi:hypothetical protein